MNKNKVIDRYEDSYFKLVAEGTYASQDVYIWVYSKTSWVDQARERPPPLKASTASEKINSSCTSLTPTFYIRDPWLFRFTPGLVSY